MAMLKLEHEKQKSLLRAELTEEKRTLEERLNAEKGSAIDELDQRYRDESMKMMESQVDCYWKWYSNDNLLISAYQSRH